MGKRINKTDWGGVERYDPTLIIIRRKQMIYNLMDRPVLTLTETTMVLGLSASTIKRRIETGQLKSVKRGSNLEKILIYTESVQKLLKGIE